MISKNGKNTLLAHGFKAKAERIAVDFREELDFKVHDPLSAFDLAKHLKITVQNPIQAGLTKSEANILMRKGSGWSGLTLVNKDDQHIIIYNSYESPGRQQSTVMHELAHVICEHALPEPKIIANQILPLRTYDPVFEEEANSLGGSLQIPRAGLLWALKRKMTVSEISDHFLASEAMVTFRINTTGVNKQLSFTKKYYAR